MQRAAASTSSPPSTPPEPPSKRQRLSNGLYNSISSTPQSDARSVEEALAVEDQKRTEALEREAANRGETNWYLSFKEPHSPATKTPLRIVSAGYAALDAADSALDRSTAEDDDPRGTPQLQGRRSFGKFNRKVEVRSPNISIGSCLEVLTETARSRRLFLRLIFRVGLI